MSIRPTPAPLQLYRRSFASLNQRIALVIWLMSLLTVVAQPVLQPLTSPNGRIQLSFQFPAPGSTGTPRWSASFEGLTRFEHCQLSLQTTDAADLLTGVRVLSEKRRSQNRRVSILHGRSRYGADRFNEAEFRLARPDGRQTVVVFRCYNDAIALRYELPQSRGQTSVVITNEATSFRPVGNPTAYVQYLENFHTSHEHPVTTSAYTGIRTGELLDMPLTLAWPDGAYAAVTEASLRRYAGMSLMRVSTTGSSDQDSLVSQLTPRADGSKVVTTLPLNTPWRVVLIGNHPGALLESSTLYCLNQPSEIGSTGWIRPGKITFHWWNGDVYDGKPGPSMLSFAMNQRYIDFCAQEGIPTHSITSTEGVTSPWYYQSQPGVAPGRDTDVTRPRSDFDLESLHRYANSKHVKLWTWVHQAALRGRVEEAFKAFKKQGWSGMMVDFFDHDDQDSVEFAESILKAAARNHILIQLHGIWKPTGLERTFPNLMNHEGALNLEYLKWSDRCTPEHNLTMAFTRLVAGRMDYHLGGFRAVTREQFQPKAVAPNVLGTRCHHLAMYVCFDNPNPMIADYPTAYTGQPGFEFLKLVPTWWDETRVLEGKVGEVLVTARRKGRDWYLGGMSAIRARELDLPVSFLGKGSFEATIWQDAEDSGIHPNHLSKRRQLLHSGDRLKVRLIRDGGFVGTLRLQGEDQ